MTLALFIWIYLIERSERFNSNLQRYREAGEQGEAK
jgi:hypothetical protein